MRVVAKAGYVRSLPRVTVALVTGCDVGVTGTATGAAATWFPRVRVLRLLRKWLGTEVLDAGVLIVDIGSRRKGLCDAFGLWNLRFEDMGAEVTKNLFSYCCDVLYCFRLLIIVPSPLS
ncbi:uncharacterized protein LOC130980008 [Arachis stenosperma]|uniref:uncharacterized protein LOC130980008 n=1 Tax=Arachis stenosperma TaxID=217475 RepID=UPI0025ABDE17|nr:uncharacterized protein LOC130980008 [Arachis stenosperma]